MKAMVEYTLGLVSGFALGVAAAFFTKRLPACAPAVISKGTGSGNLKMVLVVRNDLGMRKGKIAAQCAHAVVGCYKAASAACPDILNQWEKSGQTKVVLQLDEKGENALIALRNKAKDANLIANMIRDAGRTQVASHSATVLGIGPGPAESIDPLVKHLKLL
ncbi:uncharacterized protein [Halyomorpha halys]|uniref:uncharacterized protein n=1 Tax=Halyomorpha halys TaxID=286706 RepID=UPI0006D4E605|nr:probable peptidyl-tRNA hydrolase 2 [Halyomorpha halys]